MEDVKKKTHNNPKSGRKAEKKKAKVSADQGDKHQSRSTKAFALKSAKKAERQFRHKQDFVEKKHHIPVVDRVPIEPPPIIVAVVGPPGSGKSTLIRCLVKNFTRQSLTQIKGPVTVVVSKKRRVTFVECNNDINSMVDIAKVADLALLLVDAAYGFEMDTFEFLNICQIHGFPRIMGVLTHLDTIKNVSKQRKIKKTLKHRFWTEIYAGAKLFYLSSLKRGSYLKLEIKNLGRYISIMKFRPLEWRSAHPYLLVDRMEDLTEEEAIRQNPKIDRKICVFGYSRGAFFKQGQDVHIPGVDDFQAKEISFLSDPCPIPDKEKKRKRSLNEKEKVLYSPFSGVGGLIYDKDAVYIDLKGSHSHQEVSKPSEPGDILVHSLLKANETIDQKMAESALEFFSQAEFEDGMNDDENDGDDDEEEEDEDNFGSDAERIEGDGEVFSDMEDGEESNQVNCRDIRRRMELTEQMIGDGDAINEDLMFDDEMDLEEDTRWKEGLPSKAAKGFLDRFSNRATIQRIVYGDYGKLIDHLQIDDEFNDGLIRIRGKEKQSKVMGNNLNSIECTKYRVENQETKSWELPEVQELIMDCFVTGKWDESTDAEKVINSLDDDEVYDDFEDLEAPKSAADDKPIDKDEELKLKKLQLKENFDSNYDEKGGEEEKKTFFQEWKCETEQQAKLNREEFNDLDDETRVKYEGFKPGMYLRIEIDNVPPEFVSNFDPRYPLIVGGLLPGESMIGYNNIRIKKHRWYKRVLKSRDPLIISMGWRRFQTVTLFSMPDTNGRSRSLKYTPQHLHCTATFWGPIAPQGTGLIAFKNISDEDRDSRNFRIAATGVILQTDKSSVIMKKLKLSGTPLKICKKTAFIKGMFNSALEVTKFEGAALRTVSGIRGAVKKAIRAPNGAFRATFEDKILMSDIVFLRTWFTVFVPKFYTIVKNLLMPSEDRLKWQGMKTTGQLRAERGLHADYKKDSVYKKVAPEDQRKKFAFKPLIIPNKLQAELPYKAKPKFLPKSVVKSNRVAVIRDPEENQVKNTIQAVRAVAREKKRIERDTMTAKALKHKKEMEKIEGKRNARDRMDKKRVFMKKQQMSKKIRGDQ